MIILKISKKNFNKVLKKVTELIEKGKVVVFPTDTVYGLIADAKNEKAVKKIFKIKKRSKRKPIPIFVGSLKVVKRIAEVEKGKEKFLMKIWPGKVTTILEAKDKKFPKSILKKNKIGIRIPNYKFLNLLLKKIKKPLAQTSANISKIPTPMNIKGILKQFKNRKFQPDLIIDAGNLGQKPSIVLDLTEEPPKIVPRS